MPDVRALVVGRADSSVVKLPVRLKNEVCIAAGWYVTGPDGVGTYVVTSRSESSGTRRIAASVSTSAPGGTVTVCEPPNFNVLTLPGTARGLFGSAAAATVTCPNCKGFVPNALDSRTRTVPPPTLVCTMFRMEKFG